MCQKKECKYVEIIELEDDFKLFVHYGIQQNNKMRILWVDFTNPF
jgi:hypothetical protein